jgi:hypothetical protein
MGVREKKGYPAASPKKGKKKGRILLNITTYVVVVIVFDNCSVVGRSG